MSEEWIVIVVIFILGILATYWIIFHVYSIIHPPKSFFQRHVDHGEIKAFHSKYGFIKKK
jgi:hypothetical protein